MVAQVVGELGAQTVTVVKATFADGSLLATEAGPASTINGATLLLDAAIELPPAVDVGPVLLLVLLPPPQPTMYNSVEIKSTTPILRTFPPYRISWASTPCGIIPGT
jgi:hypothetical protein